MSEVRRVQQGRPQQLPAAGQLHPLPAVHVPPQEVAVPPGLQQQPGRNKLLSVQEQFLLHLIVLNRNKHFHTRMDRFNNKKYVHHYY